MMGKIHLNQALIYNDLRQRAQRIYSAPVPLYKGESNAWILRPAKGGPLSFLSLRHPNNRLQNIYIFICLSSTQMKKKNYS